MELLFEELSRACLSHSSREMYTSNAESSHASQAHQHETTLKERECLLKKLYGSLILLSLLNPLNDTRITNSVLRAGYDREKKLWHHFLDSLSELADYRLGGDTVSSVVPERTRVGPKYWFASNSDPRGKAYQHVKWMLGKLESAITVPRTELSAIYDRISNVSIQHGQEKVKVYRRKLAKIVETAKSDSLSGTSPVSELGK